jgi:hypothetical protein
MPACLPATIGPAPERDVLAGTCEAPGGDSEGRDRFAEIHPSRATSQHGVGARADDSQGARCPH